MVNNRRDHHLQTTTNCKRWPQQPRRVRGRPAKPRSMLATTTTSVPFSVETVRKMLVWMPSATRI